MERLFFNLTLLTCDILLSIPIIIITMNSSFGMSSRIWLFKFKVKGINNYC